MLNPLLFADTRNNILSILAAILTPKEFLALRQVCTSYNTLLTSSECGLFMPYLNRLKAIDRKVSVLPPTDPKNNPWQYDRFVSEFQRISKELIEEAGIFIRVNNKQSLDIIRGYLFNMRVGEKGYLLKRWHDKVTKKDYVIKLVDLEEGNSLLKEINEVKIKCVISDVDDAHMAGLREHGPDHFPPFDISNKGITRIPDSLVDHQIWPAITEFNCHSNHMKSLPEWLGRKCSRLKKMTCENNLLTSLPESLGNCQKLEQLQCFNNHITAVPDTLVKKFGEQWKTTVLMSQKFATLVYNIPSEIVMPAMSSTYNWLCNQASQMTSYLPGFNRQTINSNAPRAQQESRHTSGDKRQREESSQDEERESKRPKKD